MEEQLKEKQGGELEGQQIFLDYTNDKSQHVNMARKGLRGFSKFEIQLTLVISTLLISNNLLSQSENLAPA